MDIVDLFEVMIVFCVGISWYFSKEKEILKKKSEIKNIDFRPLTKEELKKYRKYGIIVFIMCFSVFLIASYLYFFLFLGYLITSIIYIILTIMCFLPYIVWFYGKPSGIKTGKLTNVDWR